MTKKAHHRIWNKKTGKMIHPKALNAKEGRKGDAKESFEEDNSAPKNFLTKLRKEIKSASSS